MLNRKIIFLAAVCLLVLTASAEEILLKDSTKITGTITGVSAEVFKIKTAYGDIQVPRKDVVSISFPENQPKTEVAADSSAVDQVIDGTTYRNHTVGLEMSVPSDWVLASQMVNKTIRGALQSKDQTQFFLLTPESYAGPLKSYRALVEAQFQSNFSEYVKEEESETNLAGKNAIRLIFQGRAKNGANLKFVVYIIADQNRMVRLAFGTLTDLFKEALPVFDKTAQSFKPIL